MDRNPTATDLVTSTRGRERLVALENFRGIAILLVVVSHSFGPWVINTFAEKMFANLVIGCTALFVFISGFFFHYVYAEGFRYGRFLVTKVRTVLLPYLLLSLVTILFHLAAHRSLPLARELGYRVGFQNRSDAWLEHARMTVVYLFTGQASPPYWFVPFIGGMFLLSPLFLLYSRSRVNVKITLSLVALAVAAWVHRPLHNLGLLHSVLYFMPFYLLGITYSTHRRSVNQWLLGRSWLFAVVTMGLAAVQAKFSPSHGILAKASILAWNGIDINLFQKVAMCFFLVSIFNDLEAKKIPALKVLASASFALYFLHWFVLDALRQLEFYRFASFIPGFYVFLVVAPLVVLLSLGWAALVRLLLGRRSRLIIGW